MRCPGKRREMDQKITNQLVILSELQKSRSRPKWHKLSDFADMFEEELAFAEHVNRDLATLTPQGEQFIGQIWQQLMRFTETADTGFSHLDELRNAIGGRR